ncbi:MAG TPA: cytochrome c [Chryseosolibacter sp.]|nr:cytochrome c [Chryseosolibacter sp.]
MNHITVYLGRQNAFDFERFMLKKVIPTCLLLVVTGCYYYEDIPRLPDPASCLRSDIAVKATPQNVEGCAKTNGSISASGSGGTPPYTFSKDGGKTMQTTGVFGNLTGGTYSIILYDATGCTDTAEVTVEILGSDFTGAIAEVAPDNNCLSDNGAVTLTGSGGTPPYVYRLGLLSNATGHFSGLASGTFNASISDAASCSINLSVTIPNESSISYKVDIAPLLTTKCNFATCHGGKSAAKNLTTYENVKANAADIKLRTGNGDMPKAPQPGGALSAEQIKIIACWVDAGAPNN